MKINTTYKILFSFLSVLLCCLTACGGTDDISIATGDDQPKTAGSASTTNTENSAPLSDGARILHVRAPVSSDSCNERISSVDQQFVVNTGASGATIDTSLVTVPAVVSNDTVTAKFSDTNGECTRTYSIQFDAVSGSTTTATLAFESTCGSRTCKSTWEGPVSEDTTLRSLQDTETLRASESVCNPNVPQDVHYRPSLFECSGNAAVLMSGNQRHNYSIVLRRNGQANDRDPKNIGCSDARCSPYKTQRKMEIPAYQVNCLGDNGFSEYFTLPNRISIKYTAKITNVNDPHQFEQYCLNSRERNLH